MINLPITINLGDIEGRIEVTLDLYRKGLYDDEQLVRRLVSEVNQCCSRTATQLLATFAEHINERLTEQDAREEITMSERPTVPRFVPPPPRGDETLGDHWERVSIELIAWLDDLAAAIGVSIDGDQPLDVAKHVDTVWVDDDVDRGCSVTHVVPLPPGWSVAGPGRHPIAALALAFILEECDTGVNGARAAVDTHGNLLLLGPYELFEPIT